MAEETTSSGLFSVFILSIYSLLLIPYTIYYLCSSGEDTAQPIAKSKKKKESTLEALSKRLCTKRNLILLALWVGWVGMLMYTQANMADLKPFDPFEILGVGKTSSKQEIRKAYYKLSKEYHPDKNPDPKAHRYFAEYITKAYQALTDEVSRITYEKYGHPDGPQGINLGVALPSWMFNKDRKAAPLMLLGLVGVGILLPLSIISWYMLSNDKYSGPNRIHNETLGLFMYTKMGIKESQSLVRIPETLMWAVEFINLYTPPDHSGPMEELRKRLTPSCQDVMAKDKKAFWQRRGSQVKSHMLLLAHLERFSDKDIPPQLLPDLKFVLTKAPLLLEEMVKIATLPRNNFGHGWMTPAMASVEMMQCISQALPVNVRKGGGKGGDAAAPLLQLPNVDSDVLKRLRKQKISSLKDLQDLSEEAQAKALTTAGMEAGEVEGVITFLTAFPQLALAARCEVEGEEEIIEQDPVKCRVRVLLRRPSHQQEGYKLAGKAVRAYTPHYPLPRDESWYFFLTDPANNAVFAWSKATLMEAEKEGLAHPEAFEGEAVSSSGRGGGGGGRGPSSNGYVLVEGADKQQTVEEGDEAEQGQEVEMIFMAPKAGKYDLVLQVMSDCWVGADVSLPVKLKVSPLSRAAAEGRDPKSKAVAKQWASDSEEEDEADEEGGSSEGSGSGDAEDEDYDSEETGEEESDEE